MVQGKSYHQKSFGQKKNCVESKLPYIKTVQSFNPPNKMIALLGLHHEYNVMTWCLIFQEQLLLVVISMIQGSWSCALLSNSTLKTTYIYHDKKRLKFGNLEKLEPLEKDIDKSF